MTTLSFEALWRDRGATAGLRGLATSTKTARQAYDDLRTATVRAAGAMKNAQLNIADATRAVAVQEARLAEARASGKAKTSQILAIEDRLASARRREADATEAAKRAAVDLTQAQEREQRALQKTSFASVAASKAMHGLHASAMLAAKGGMGALGAGATVAARSVGKVTSVLGGAAAAVTRYGAIALVAGGAAAAAFGIKVASSNEQARISFTTMLGSAQKADKFLRQLQKFAAATPFEFPELQTAASSLISVGIKAEKIIPIMTSLGNATSGMGTGAEGVKRATVALQQMNAAGRITAQDLNQLRDAGIPVYDLLTKATGKSTAQIAKMAQSGKLGRKELEQMMKALESGKGLERFAGLMDQQSRSLAGLASTFHDVAGQALAGLATSAFPLMKSGLASISTGLGHLSAWVKDNKGALGTVFSVLGRTVSTLGQTVMTVFTSFARSAGIGKGSFKDFADFLSTHQEAITRGIISGAKAFIAFGRTVAVIASGSLRAFGTLADGIGVALSFVLDEYAALAHGAAVAFGWIPGIGPKLLAADAKFTIFAARTRGHMTRTGDAARTLADGIDNGIIPAFDKAGLGLDAFGKKATTSAHAQDALARAGINHRKVLADALAGVKAYGKGLDTNTAAGVLNRRALQNLIISSQTYISRLAATHASSRRVTQATQAARDEFVRVATKMGLSTVQAGKLAAAYFHIPTKHSTVITQPGMPHALESAAELRRRINNIKDKTVRLSMQYTASASKGLLSVLKNVPGSQASGFVGAFSTHATGGPIQNVSGRGVKGKDTELVVTAVGEHVWTDKEVDAVGGHSAMYRMRRDARRGAFKGYADGGAVQRNLTIDTRTDAIPSSVNRFGPAGLAAASAVGSAAMRSLGSVGQKAINALLASAAAAGGAGGPVAAGGYARALAYARRHVGHPYIFATIWDCSGFMSSLQSIILGQQPHRRYTTTAFHGPHAAGFTRGKRSPFMVGVRPLAGKFGHMAGTLNGVNVESAGGVGVRVGGRARGYNNGMFSWRGGLAGGGPIQRGMGDMPFDLLDPEGERYQPWLADLVHKAGYNRGGRIGGDGPERILSAQQNRAFEHLVRVMDRRGGGGTGTVVNQYISLPNWLGSTSDLKRALVDMSRRGELAVITGR